MENTNVNEQKEQKPTQPQQPQTPVEPMLAEGGDSEQLVSADHAEKSTKADQKTERASEGEESAGVDHSGVGSEIKH